MARARNIKPGFFQNEDIADLPFATRLLFIGLWTLADRDGYLEDRPKRIKMALFPGDDVNVDKALNELQHARFIRRYTVGEGRYIEVCQFKKHQNPHHREPESTIPKPEASPRLDGVGNGTKPEALPPCNDDEALGEPEAGTGQVQGEPRSSPADSLIPDSLIPESRETPLRDLASARDQRQAFEDWWKGYPRKVGKADAEKAWLKIKPDAEMRETLAKAVAAQRQWETWKRDGGRFIPHAATWLNGKRWADESDAVAGPGGYDWKAIARAAGYTEQEIAADAPH